MNDECFYRYLATSDTFVGANYRLRVAWDEFLRVVAEEAGIARLLDWLARCISRM